MKISLISMLILIFSGCNSDLKGNVNEYGKYLRITIVDKACCSINGIISPKFTLCIKNVGNKNVSYIKIIGDVKFGNHYSDSKVIICNKALPKETGSTSVNVEFGSSGNISEVETLLGKLKCEFIIDEIDF